eukprot:16446304-Heterocapsa_arctica.AAC.1
MWRIELRRCQMGMTKGTTSSANGNARMKLGKVRAKRNFNLGKMMMMMMMMMIMMMMMMMMTMEIGEPHTTVEEQGDMESWKLAETNLSKIR